MGRPATSTIVSSHNYSNAEKRQRKEIEETLKGKPLTNIKPPKYLNTNQRKIFKMLFEQLKDSNILSNIDIFILSSAAIAIDRLQEMEEKINNDITLLSKSAFMSSKQKYTEQFWKACNELCLSPQSRAKFAGLKIQSQDEQSNPLLQVLIDDDADG